jgi:hypothetical protein
LGIDERRLRALSIRNQHSAIRNGRSLAQRKAFLLRIDPAVLEALQRWADDDLRSLNGQIEFLLRRVLADAGRAAPKDVRPVDRSQDEKDHD